MKRVLLIPIGLVVLGIAGYIFYTIFSFQSKPSGDSGQSDPSTAEDARSANLANGLSIYHQQSDEFTVSYDAKAWRIAQVSPIKTVFFSLAASENQSGPQIVATSTVTLWTENVFETSNVTTKDAWLQARGLVEGGKGIKSRNQTKINGSSMEQFLISTSSGGEKVLFAYFPSSQRVITIAHEPYLPDTVSTKSAMSIIYSFLPSQGN